VKYGEWHGLAMALAVAHVPGFQHSRRGRKPSQKLAAKRFRQWWDAQPNKSLALNSMPSQLAAQALSLRTKPRVGRPKKHSLAKDRSLVKEADKWLQEQSKAGGRRISDRAFVANRLGGIFSEHPDWLSESARDHRTTKAGAFKRQVSYWTVRLARARKAVSKI
jgi:hypothetical protein